MHLKIQIYLFLFGFTIANAQEQSEKNLQQWFDTKFAKQNLDITLAKFKIGTITPIEYRTAQLNYVNALVRYSNAQFQTKLFEISLKELSGTLGF